MAQVPEQETRDNYRWIVSADAGRWLSDLAMSKEPLHRGAERLRRELPAPRVHLLLEQVELRARGREKFAAANRMFFTRTALEQATDQWIAAYKADRFGGGERVADLCCGIGGDLLGIAERCNAIAVDLDPVALILAEANVAAVLGETTVARTCFVASEAVEWPVDKCDAWHIDPDRRAGGRRTTKPQLSSPDLDVVSRLVARNVNAAIKLAPAASAPESWQATSELEWIGRGGECRQLVAWHGKLAQVVGERRATIIERPSSSCGERFALAGSLTGTPNQSIDVAVGPRRFVYEPESAVLAARLQPALARRHQVQALSTDGFWLTGDAPVADGCLACFEVLDVLPMDRRQLARYFAARSVGTLEIKTRGVDVAPERLRKELKLKGDQPATVIVASVGSVLRAIVARRCGSLL